MTVDRATLDRILDQARWAPSGDNSQCWRFEVVADDHVVVHGFDTRHQVVYDLDGTSSWIAIGALLETMAIAATRFGLKAIATRRPDATEEEPRFDVRIVAEPALRPDPLADVVETRSVQRRALSTRPLTTTERDALDASVGPDHAVAWVDGDAGRRSMARLLFDSAHLRLTMPEAYPVHRDAIAWGQRFSDDRVPEQAVGMDPVAAPMMRWVMGSWDRVRFFNRFLAGTWMPRIQLDVIPALRCAAHFAIYRKQPPQGIDDFVAGGRAMQRFWLTAAALGLQLQPEMTPLIFARYSREGRRFSTREGADSDARAIAAGFEARFGTMPARQAVFMGRVGAGKAATARSLRLPLSALMYDEARWAADQKLRRTST